MNKKVTEKIADCRVCPGVMVVLRDGRTVVALEEPRNIQMIPETQIPGWGIICGFDALDGDTKIWVLNTDVVHCWYPEAGEND